MKKSIVEVFYVKNEDEQEYDIQCNIDVDYARRLEIDASYEMSFSIKETDDSDAVKGLREKITDQIMAETEDRLEEEEYDEFQEYLEEGDWDVTEEEEIVGKAVIDKIRNEYTVYPFFMKK